MACGLLGGLTPSGSWAQRRAATPADTDPVGPNYMTKAMVPRLKFDVMHTTTGPRDNIEDSVEYPLTCALASSIKLRDTTWDGDKGLFVWDDRSDGGPAARPNGLRDNVGAIRNSHGQECRTRFSSIPLAMASNEARIAHHLGYPPSVVDGIIAQAGLNPNRDRYYLEDILRQNAVDQVFNVATDSRGSLTRGQGNVVYACTVDKVILPNWRFRDAKGRGRRRVVLDYETHDGRSPDMAIAHLRRIKELTSRSEMGNLPLHAICGPLTNRRQIQSGLSPEAMPAIHRIVDVWYLTVSGIPNESVTQQIESQFAMFRGGPIDYSRLAFWFQFGTHPSTTVEDAKVVHDTIVARRMFGIGCWDNAAKWGGGKDRITVQKQHMAFFGRLPD